MKYSASNLHPGQVSKDAIFIIGAGHFGARAARLLSEHSGPAVFVVDLVKERLARLGELPVRVIPYEGVRFLIKNASLLRPSNTVVPAVPFHLAFEWLKTGLDSGRQVVQIPVPEGMGACLPHWWPGSEGSLLVSYADFKCPDNCPEPESCTVTGERRASPMYDLLRGLDVPSFDVYVIRSHQLAPGLGGYRMSQLSMMAQRLNMGQGKKWLLGTACKCHGILTAFKIDEPAKSH